jgi:hypothetical protein
MELPFKRFRIKWSMAPYSPLSGLHDDFTKWDNGVLYDWQILIALIGSLKKWMKNVM